MIKENFKTSNSGSITGSLDAHWSINGGVVTWTYSCEPPARNCAISGGYIYVYKNK